MSKPTWQASFQTALQRSRRPNPPSNPPAAADARPRIVILGIGNETNGDDAAGGLAARALAERLAGRGAVRVIDAGIAPENQTGPVRRFAPDLVVMIDAAQMDDTPGAIRWLDWAETDGLSASTHTLPPYILAKFLVAEIGCAVGLIGIQPAQNGFGVPLSDVMMAAVEVVVDGVAAELDALT